MNYISSYRKVVLRADLRLTLDHSSRLEWCMCWECLSCTHHWANVPIVSFLPWWAWHSLQKQIWWCTLHRKRHIGKRYKLKYKCEIKDEPKEMQSVLEIMVFFLPGVQRDQMSPCGLSVLHLLLVRSCPAAHEVLVHHLNPKIYSDRSVLGGYTP